MCQKDDCETNDGKYIRDCKMRRRNERIINELITLALDIKESTVNT